MLKAINKHINNNCQLDQLCQEKCIGCGGRQGSLVVWLGRHTGMTEAGYNKSKCKG